VGYSVTQLVETLSCNSEGREFDFKWGFISSDHTMALGLTQFLRETHTSDISRVKGGQCVGLISLPQNVPIA